MVGNVRVRFRGRRAGANKPPSGTGTRTAQGPIAPPGRKNENRPNFNANGSPVTDADFHGLRSSLQDLNFELNDTDCWEHLLVGEPFTNRVLPPEVADAEAEEVERSRIEAEKHLDMPASWVKILTLTHAGTSRATLTFGLSKGSGRGTRATFSKGSLLPFPREKLLTIK